MNTVLKFLNVLLSPGNLICKGQCHELKSYSIRIVAVNASLFCGNHKEFLLFTYLYPLTLLIKSLYRPLIGVGGLREEMPVVRKIFYLKCKRTTPFVTARSH